MENYLIAKVTFVNGFNTSKQYAFRLYDSSIHVGDYVLTDSANDFVVAKVVDVIIPSLYHGVEATKDIICKVDLTAWNRRKAERVKQMADKAKLDKLVSAMEQHVKDNDNLSLYRQLATNDPALQKMINEYDRIKSGKFNDLSFNF